MDDYSACAWDRATYQPLVVFEARVDCLFEGRGRQRKQQVLWRLEEITQALCVLDACVEMTC